MKIKNIKFIMLLSLACILSFSIALYMGSLYMGSGVANELPKNYENIFSVNEVVLTDNVDYGEYNGINLQVDGDKTVSFKNSFYGEFDFEFKVVTVDGKPNLNKIKFVFTESLTRKTFDVNFYNLYSFFENNTKIEKPAIEVAIPQRTDRSVVKESFCSFAEEDKTCRIVFNPNNMVVYTYINEVKTAIMDLRDTSLFASFYNSHAIYDYFNEYSVAIQFVDVNNEVNIIALNLNGQSLAGEILINEKPPVICNIEQLPNGVVNKEYSVSTKILTYDVIDGYNDNFNGEINIKSPSGNEILLVKNVFVPTENGDYEIIYTPEDKNGLKGESVSKFIKVFSVSPKIDFNYSFLLKNHDEIALGSTLLFPNLTATSLLNDDVKIETFINGDLILFEDDGYLHAFDELGQTIVLYKATDKYGCSCSQEFVFNVVEGQAFESPNFERIQQVGNTFLLPTAKIGGETVTAVLEYPDGRTIASKYAILDQKGNYFLNYSNENGNYSVGFSTILQGSGFWISNQDINYTNNATSPEYADANYKGVLVSANENNATINYTKPINLKDNTSNDLLLELFIAPTKVDEHEFTILDVTLTDSVNKNEKVTIRLERITANNLYHYVHFASACANSKNQFSEQKPVMASFYGKFQNNHPSQSVKIYYDYLTDIIYMSTLESVKAPKGILVDLRDEKQVGINNAFSGFSSGVVELSITFKKLAKSSANVMLINVDGNEMYLGQTKDICAPEILINFDGYDQAQLPYGVVGNRYKIFDFTTTDFLGFVKEKGVRVYRKAGNNKVEYKVENNCFIPDVKGIYFLEYYAIDDNFNESTKTISTVVLENSEVSNLDYQFDQVTNEFFVGKEIVIPNGKAYGLSDKGSITREILLNGEKIDYIGNSFVPMKSGEYILKVTLKEYAYLKTFELKMSIDFSEEPIMFIPFIPKAMIVGDTLDFSMAYGVDYSNGNATKKDVELKIDGNIISNLKYVPVEQGIKDIVLNCVGQNGTAQYSTKITVLNPQTSDEFSQGYFYQENANVSVDNLSISFESEENKNSYVTFARKINARKSLISLSLPNTNESFDKLKVYLTDSINSDQKISFEVSKNQEGKTLVTVDDKTVVIAVDAFTNTTALQITYINETTSFVDEKNNFLGKVRLTESGKTFNGFDSGFYYISFEYSNATLKVMKIANQMFGSMIFMDTIGPVILVNDIEGEVAFGEKIIVPTAYVSDVLGNVVETKIEITAPNNEIIELINGFPEDYLLDINQYGNYVIAYIAKDSANKTTRVEIDFTVFDRIKPVLEIKGTVPSFAKVGKEIKLPKAVATDNVDKNLTIKVYCLDVVGQLISINNYETKFNKVGKYTLLYSVSDNAGNSTIKQYEIIVQ